MNQKQAEVLIEIRRHLAEVNDWPLSRIEIHYRDGEVRARDRADQYRIRRVGPFLVATLPTAHPDLCPTIRRWGINREQLRNRIWKWIQDQFHPKPQSIIADLA